MADQIIVIVLEDGTELEVTKQTLTADSRKFRYLIEELNQTELQFDDFPADIVGLFITLLDDMELNDVKNEQFRELNKLATLFEVEWLRASCKKWLEGKIDSAKSDEEKTYVFEECLYILRKWKQRDEMDSLLSKLATQDNNSFISQYMLDLNGLDKTQLNLMLKIGGSDTEFFLRMIISNLEGKTELPQNVQYLLENINLALCFEKNNQQLYFDVRDAIEKLSEISIEDMRFAFHLTTETMQSVCSRTEERKTRTRLLIDYNRYRELLDSCKTVDDITAAILDNRVRSMYQVFDLLLSVFYIDTRCSEGFKLFLTKMENMCREKKLQKISRDFLKMNIAALNYSPLYNRLPLIEILEKIKDNDSLSTCHENVIVKLDKEINVSPFTGKRVLSTVKNIMKRDKCIPAGTVINELITFKHPSTLECTQPGRCGFIVQVSKPDKNNVIYELSTNSEDYTNTGLHLHDIISASDMYVFGIWSGSTAPDNKVQVGGWLSWWEVWLPDVSDWDGGQSCVVYNVSDYTVSKQH